MTENYCNNNMGSDPNKSIIDVGIEFISDLPSNISQSKTLTEKNI